MDGGNPGNGVDLSALYQPPSQLARTKQIDHLDKWCRKFISLSPFLCLSTVDADGRMDVSPRGDPPGFVKVLDDKRLAIPDRPGNNRLDCFHNLQATGRVGLLFFIPGIDEMLRVNGHATLERDPALLAGMAVEGKVPKLAVIVTVEEAFLHCAKAIRRGKLWDASRHVARDVFPSMGQILVEQGNRTDITAEAADARIEKGYRENMY